MAKEKHEFSLEEKLTEIKALIGKMQLGNQDFDENIRMFQRGTELIEACRKYLDEAELSVRQLVDGEDGAETEEFE